MRIARYESEGVERLGCVVDGEIWQLPEGTGLLELLAAEPREREEVAQAAQRSGGAIGVADVRLLPPLHPVTLRDFVTFEQHVEGVVKIHLGPDAGVTAQWYEAPTFYFTNPHAVVGAHDPVAAVIGRAGQDLAPEQARDHIAAYTIFNDWTARDLQFREMQVGLGPAKGKDFANTLGPWLVTADELEPYRRDGRLDLGMAVSVNGTEIGRDTLANMAWSFEEMVAYASRGTWVCPGDVLGSGTCGSGCLAELWGRAGRHQPPPLVPGDVVTMTVEGIGTISNRVVPGVDPVPVPRARTGRREPVR